MRLRWLLATVLSASLFGLVACGGGNSNYLPPVDSPLVPYEPPEIAQEDSGDDDPEVVPDDGADDDDDDGATKPPAGGTPAPTGAAPNKAK